MPMNLELAVPLLATAPSPALLRDLKSPKQFDDLAPFIDKAAFYLLEPAYKDNDLLLHRKAQLLIDDHELEQAMAVLSSFDTVLAEGLMSRAMARAKAWSVVRLYTQDYSNWSKARCLSLASPEQEGLVYLYESAFYAALEDKNLDYAAFLLSRAAYLATELELGNTLSQLETNRLTLLSLSET